MVLAVNAARKDMRRPAFILFVLAWLCGAGFAACKVLEYSEKIKAGIGLTTNDFFMYYFIFTGLHFLHVLIGMALLVVLGIIARRGISKPSDLVILEGGASRASGAPRHHIDVPGCFFQSANGRHALHGNKVRALAFAITVRDLGGGCVRRNSRPVLVGVLKKNFIFLQSDMPRHVWRL